METFIFYFYCFILSLKRNVVHDSSFLCFPGKQESESLSKCCSDSSPQNWGLKGQHNWLTLEELIKTCVMVCRSCFVSEGAGLFLGSEKVGQWPFHVRAYMYCFLDIYSAMRQPGFNFLCICLYIRKINLNAKC